MSAERPDVEALVERYIELRERGEAPSAAAYVRAHPAAGEPLRVALEALGWTEELWPEPVTALPGHVGRYRVLGEIGRGGMGRVLRVEDPDEPGSDLALKLLDAPLASAERALERFRREGEILRGLSHPGIVRVRDVDVAGSTPFIVMDLVRGESLASAVTRARDSAHARGDAPCEALALPGDGPGWQRVATLVAALARSVSALHAAGMLHRDLKPANVLLDPHGHPVLVDFGLVHSESAETLTRTGDLLGTPQYMPPEQARGERLDDRADVYGLGCILYELLTLRPPHGGDDPVRVLERVRTRPIDPVRRHARATPRDLGHIVARALAHHRRHRTSNAALLAADLEACAAGRPVLAGPPSAGERLSRLWTFQRARLLVLATVLVLAASIWPWLEARRTQARSLAHARFERAVAAWCADDDEGVRVELAGLAGDPFVGGWAGFLAALVANQDPPASPDPALAAAIDGWRLVRERRPKDALVDLRRSATLAAENVLPVLLLAEAASAADEHSMAAAEYTAASRLLPGSAAVQRKLARARYEDKRDDEAQRAAERALELDGTDADTWHLLARIHYRRAQFPEGLAAARRSVELAGPAAPRRMRKTLAALLDNNKLHEESQAVLRRLIEEDPRDAAAYFNLAYSYDYSHKVREAHDTYVRVRDVGARAKAQVSLAFLLAGAKSDECAECRAVYAANPDLLDPDRAEDLAIEALGVRAGMDISVPLVAAQVALKLGRRERIRAAIEALQEGEERDDRIAANERALRLLRE